MGRRSRSERWFNRVNVVVMVLVAIALLIPFWFILVGSLDQGNDYLRGGVYFWPRVFTWANYQAVFSEPQIYSAFFVTAARTVVGTVTGVLFTALVAYGMTRKALKGRTVYTWMMLVTMFFSGGLIPTYLLYEQLRLLNSFWVYIVPWLFSVWNMIIFRAFFRSIPESMIEAAHIDGAGEYRTFFSIVLPMAKPALAALSMFTAVAQWNSYYDSLLFTSSSSLQTLQLLLYNIITSPAQAAAMGNSAALTIPSEAVKISPETLQMALMIAVAAPLLIVYPFLQKFFVKGVFIGSVTD